MTDLVLSGTDATGTLSIATNGASIFVYGNDQLTFTSGLLQSYSSANGVFDFVIAPASAAYTENVTWDPISGVANLVLTPTGGQPVTTFLGQINPGSVFLVSSATITNTNPSGQPLLSTTINPDGSQLVTTYSVNGSAVTTLNTLGQQTSVRYDNTDGSTYTSYTNPTTQALIASFSVDADGSGYVTTPNDQSITFASGNAASVSIGSAGDTLLTIKTISGTGIVESFDLSNGQIVSTINGNVLTYSLTNAVAAIDSLGNVTITGGGGSTITLPASGANATFTLGQDSLSFPQNKLHSLSASSGGSYIFGVTSSVSGFSESIDWNPITGIASLVLTPTAGGASITTSIGQINHGDVLSVLGSTIIIAGSNGIPLASTVINADGSQIDTVYSATGNVRKTVTDINAAGQVTSVFSVNADNSTYTTYYTPGTEAVIANLSINADGSGYVATANNHTVNFASGNLVSVSVDTAGNPLVNLVTNVGSIETLDLGSGQIVSTINGISLTYALPNPAISYDSVGDLTLTAAGSTLFLPATGVNYIFTVGQDVITLAPASVLSVTPNGTGYTFNLKPQGAASEYVSWNPQTGIATLNLVSASNQLTSTNLGYINPGDVLNVSSSLITSRNADGLITNAYAVQSNGSVTSTVSGSTISLSINNGLVGLSDNDTATITGIGNIIDMGQNDKITLSGSTNTVAAEEWPTGDVITLSGNSSVKLNDIDNMLGAGETINITGTGGSAVYDADSTTDTVDVFGNGKNGPTDAVALSSGTINVGTNANAYIIGGGNKIAAGQTDFVSLQGGNGNIVALGNNSDVYINSGNSDVVQAGASTGGHLTIQNSDDDTAYIGSGGAVTIASGYGDAIYLANGDSISIAGNGQTGPTDAVALSSGTITVASNANAYIVGGGDEITVGQSDFVSLQGGNGNTATLGKGSNVYINSGNNDVVQASASTGDHLTIQNSDNDTAYIGSGGTVTIVSGYGDAIYLANGDSISIAGNGQSGPTDAVKLSSGTINVGTNANAYIIGGSNAITAAQNDTLTLASGSGNTVIAGGGGDIFNNTGGSTNTYDFGASFGSDTIINSGSGSTVANGTIAFTSSGASDENLWFQKSGNNLEIDLLGTSNQITVANWFGSNASAQVSSFSAGGLTLDGQVAQLVSAMATYAANNTGFNPTTATSMPTDTALQTAIAAAWHH